MSLCQANTRVECGRRIGGVSTEVSRRTRLFSVVDSWRTGRVVSHWSAAAAPAAPCQRWRWRRETVGHEKESRKNHFTFFYTHLPLPFSLPTSSRSHFSPLEDTPSTDRRFHSFVFSTVSLLRFFDGFTPSFFRRFHSFVFFDGFIASVFSSVSLLPVTLLSLRRHPFHRAADSHRIRDYRCGLWKTGQHAC